MNRLVIIGNGFDLAHGLPTSYKDFIDDYWRNFKTNCKSEEYTKLITTHDSYNNYYLHYSPIENFNDFKSNLTQYCKDNSYKYSEDKLIALATPTTKTIIIFEFKSDFFKIINKKNSQNWVDIENEYYYQLKKIIKSESLDTSKSKEFWSNEQRIQVEKLNNDFEQVKNLLEKYLVEKVLNKFDFINEQNADRTKFYDKLKPISLFSNEGNILKEFINTEDVNEIKELFKKEREEELVNNLYFLNFNYTPIASIYCDSLGKNDRIQSSMNFIHGSLGNVLENKINFGFGDEMDDEYKAIENLNDNEYLNNFKSFQYLQNSNYKDLLNYVDSNKFQVLIMGHSCGLSDRTLLNTIFEHNNCRSIKVFYHERGDGTDNFTEIIQNISRHFNKKKLMREKIVNKTLCKPLPQIQLPLK